MTATTERICHLIKDLQTSATANATEKVNQILNVSANYLSESNHEKLKMFHDLYFAPEGTLESQKSSMNAQVDDIFDQAQQLASQNLSESDIVKNLKVSEQSEKDRLQLSGLQKKLEALISFEDGLKEELAPVMNSMQFEDAMRQRIEHVVEMFELVVTNEVVRHPERATEIVALLADRITIQSERESFYRLVMHEEAPAHVEQDSFFF